MNQELELLREIAPDPERMTAVRRRVLDAIAADSGPRRRLLLAWTFSAAAAAVAMLLLWPRPEPLDPSWIELPAAVQPPAFAYELTPPRPEPPKLRPTPKPPQPAIEVIGSTDDGVQLRLASSDPDVILYYFVDATGE